MWTKNMLIQVNAAGVILADPDNSNQKLAMHRIEEITQSAAILDDEDFGDLTAYVTEHKKNSVVHIFQTRDSAPDTKLTITGGMNRPPFEQSDASKALFDHASTLAAEIGFELVGEKTGGGSDGNFIADRIPTLDGLGPDGDDVHTLNEHIFVSSLKPRMLLLKRLMETLS